ncbi:hypothetical protein [Palleronia caenipelagi]|uniref:Uncharacterized protein n=1 Tax=Palleronia caenipelagi TaxID=2489174 RepID=A0A547Q6C6_9RHOB|nr:hypothetical protein [Palleronia caenipelagi]TRD21921.1 hypothetical protein FEV53_07680 [Palleronia caenipelagi]
MPAGELIATWISSSLVSVSKLIAALSAISASLFLIARPHLEGYLVAVMERANHELAERIEVLSDQVGVLADRVEQMQPRELVDFRGNPVLALPGPFAPGSSVPLVYVMRKNAPCDAIVTAQFISSRTLRLDPSLTYTTPAQRAPVTDEFSAFTVEVALPEDMRAGDYSYLPQIDPVDCPGFSRFSVPPSPVFEVRAE